MAELSCFYLTECSFCTTRPSPQSNEFDTRRTTQLTVPKGCGRVLDVYGSQPCWHPDATLYLRLGLQLSKGEFQFQVPKWLLKLITTF